jgi:hypothetical protein
VTPEERSKTVEREWFGVVGDGGGAGRAVLRGLVLDAVRGAVAAERERAAKVVESYAAELESRPEYHRPSPLNALRYATQRIREGRPS